jgi:hypothetical protein
MYINYSVEVKTFTKHPLLLMTLTRDPHNRTGLLNTMQSSIFRRWGDPKVPACSETKTISENSPKDTLVGVKQHHPPLRTVGSMKATQSPTPALARVGKGHQHQLTRSPVSFGVWASRTPALAGTKKDHLCHLTSL